VNGALALGRVEGATQCLAVDGDEFAVRCPDDSVHPTQKALLERGRIHRGEDAAEGVVGRNPVGQIEKGDKPVPLFFGVRFDVGPMITPGNDSTEGDGDDVEQAVKLGVVGAWVVKIGKMVQKGDRGVGRSGHAILREEAFRVFRRESFAVHLSKGKGQGKIPADSWPGGAIALAYRRMCDAIGVRWFGNRFLPTSWKWRKSRKEEG
jgi:hypothetical protein